MFNWLFSIPKILNYLEDLMSLAADLKTAVADLKREVAETAAELKTQLDKIAELIAQDATDAELRAAVEEALPELQEQVAALDALQTKPAPPAPPAG